MTRNNLFVSSAPEKFPVVRRLPRFSVLPFVCFVYFVVKLFLVKLF
jgi:hypothetical protein